MITPQDSRFWQAAVRSGLLDSSALQKSWDAIDLEKRTPEAIDRRLARQAVNSGVLTLWQAQQILAGRWQGLRIDKYELRDVIGQGGMGRVYLARDVRLNRKVALKILSRERMHNERAMARFRREAKVGAQLQHENLVRIYDEGEAHGVRYLVMEYIEGKTVGRLIAELGTLPPLSAADITRKVAMGLEHLHQKGLLHRDVNPMNILIDRDGTAKLTDLGLAIDLGDDDEIVTRDGATVGTFDYISPEQAKHSRMVDARADTYSLGCTLYHMITGRVPFPTPSLPEKLYAHQLNDPEPIANLCPDVPEGLVAVVAKMMRKAPEDRYRRASDVAKALEPFAISSLSASRLGSGLSTTQEAAAVNGVPNQPSMSPSRSDPDLAYQPQTPVGSSPSSTKTPIGPGFHINLDPEPPLSEIRSGVRSRSRSGDTIERRTRLRRLAIRGLAASLAVLIMAGVAYFGYWFSTRGKGVRDGSNARRSSEVATRTQNQAEITIRFANGDELAQPSLRDAIRRLSGAGGEIVLRSSQVFTEASRGTLLRLADGHLVIRAEKGTKAELHVELSRNLPWLEIGTRARLTLSGLTIRTEISSEAGTSASKPPPSLLRVEGNVSLEQCSFTMIGSERSPHVLVGRGLSTRITGCLFDGFDQPINLTAYSGAQATITQTIFMRHPVNSLAGWAVAVARAPGAQATAPVLTMEHCTVIGAGVLAAELFTPDDPLKVSLTNSAIQTSSLLMTAIPAENLAKSIEWTGRENLYALSSVAWVVVPPKGFDALTGGPVNIKGWTNLYPTETGSDAAPIKFAGSSMNEGQAPGDFAVATEASRPSIGADPAKVGPLASP